MKSGTPNFRGPRLREAREARGLTGTALADLLGVTRGAVSQYENGLATPHPTVMENISGILRMPTEFFSYDARWPLARPRFMRSMATATKTARTRAERRYEWLVALGRYLSGFVTLPTVNLPKLDTPTQLGDITDEFIDDAAESVRRHWKLGDGPISNVVWLLENNGCIIAQSELWGEKLDALSDVDDEFDGRPYVVLGLDKRSAVRSRFDAAHELGHMILHRRIDRSRIFKAGSPEFEIIENQAHRFAGAFLLPRDSFGNDFRVPTLDAFLALKKKWLASVSMMTMRCAQLDLISEDQLRFFHINISRRKWRQREPFDDTMVPEQPRLLKRAIEMIVSNGVQSRDQIAAAVPVPASDIEGLANLEKGYLTLLPDIVRLKESDKIVKFPK